MKPSSSFNFMSKSTRLLALPWLIPLPNDKILKVNKLKTFADDKFNLAKMTISVFDRVENTVGKGEIAGYQHFLLFPQCFPKSFSLGSLKDGIVWLIVRL